MADTKVSALTAAATLTGAEQVPVVQGAASVRSTAGEIARTYTRVKSVATDQADTTGTAVAVTDLTSTGLLAGTYLVRGTMLWKTAATTTGIGMFLNVPTPAGSVNVYATYATLTSSTGTANGIADPTTTGNNTQMIEGKGQDTNNVSPGPWPGVLNANVPGLTVIQGLLILTATNSLNLMFHSEVAASAATILKGSTLTLEKVA